MDESVTNDSCMPLKDEEFLKQLSAELNAAQQEHRALKHFTSITEKNLKHAQDELTKQEKCRRDLETNIRRIEQQIEAEKFKISVGEKPGDLFLVQTFESQRNKLFMTKQTCFATFHAATTRYGQIMYQRPIEATTIWRNMCGPGTRLLCMKGDYDERGDSFTLLVQLRPK